MRLFSYYALHTFKNQLKKLFKTWVLIFIVACMVFGGLIGIIAGSIAGAVEDDSPDYEASEEWEAEDDEAFLEIETEGLDAGAADLIELIAGGIILVIFVIMALGADKSGSSIFLPADVNILFASPMKPQSVLMFRLTTKLGAALLGSFYMLFQLPNLTLNLGLSIWAALSIIAVWCFTIVLSTLVQLLLYMLAATYPKVKRNLRVCVYVLLLAIAAGYLLCLKRSGEGFLSAAMQFFNGKYSRFIPIWGWLKGLCMYAIEGNIAGVAGCFAAIVLGSILLIFFIWRIKADFYEDAMAKSEQTAELLAAAQSEKSTGMIRRKKDRSEKLRRDGFRRGLGANIFFYKSMYNRFRFAHFGFATKTMETYLVAAIGVGALCRFAFDTTSIIPLALVLAALAFYRTLGNPLEEDTKMDYFIMIPESNWAKLFWSLMGGTANCLLDLLPAMLVGALLLQANLLAALAWIPFVLSIDFYATNVSTFINLSVPVNAGKIVKQLVQILFLYFGLLPDAGILAAGFLLGFSTLGIIGAAVCNIGLGFLFFALSPIFLDPR